MKILEIFKKKEVVKKDELEILDTVEAIDIKEQIKETLIINSEIIQKDLKLSFDRVLEEFNLDPSKETQVEELSSKLEDFKESNKEIYDKIELLKDLNLTNTPSVTKSLSKLKTEEEKIKGEIRTIESELNYSKKIQELITKYNIQYPGYKFITDNVMIDIMKKYDLVLGESFMYSREIPNKSLNIITNFTKEIKESEKTLLFVEETYPLSIRGYKKFIEGTKVDEDQRINYRYELSSSYRILNQFNITKFKMIAPMSHFTIPTYKENEWNNINSKFKTFNLFKLDLNTRKFIPDYQTLAEHNQKMREVLDPIACLEVEGGYIIMDAWDKEAEIPEIKNPILN